MWLIDVKTYTLVQFPDERPLKGTYAILSHTWEDGELEFADLPHGGASETHAQAKAGQKKGYAKVIHLCALAASEGIEYVWLDTACIQKSSSAELSDAINSMFRWYRNAKVCYAYLSDLKDAPDQELNIGTCRWFTRGWTLQEMLAPTEVVFLDSNWKRVGTRSELSYRLQIITGISQDVICESSLIGSCSVSERMAWAASRSTTREEDSAYCLLGIFDINMPMLYGEGAKAFLRLQEQILQRSVDFSLLAWKMRLPVERNVLLAPEVSRFKRLEHFTSNADVSDDGDHRFTGKGLYIRLPIRSARDGDSEIYAALNCTSAEYSGRRIPVLRLRRVSRQQSKAPAVYEVVREIGEQSLQPQQCWTTEMHEKADGVDVRDIVILYQRASMSVYIDTSFDVQPEPPRLDWDPGSRKLDIQQDRGSMSNPTFALDCTLEIRDPDLRETLLLSIKYPNFSFRTSFDWLELRLSSPGFQPRGASGPRTTKWSHPSGTSEFWATSWNSRQWDIPPGVHIVRIWKCQRLSAGTPSLTGTEVRDLPPSEIIRRRWTSPELSLASVPKADHIDRSYKISAQAALDRPLTQQINVRLGALGRAAEDAAAKESLLNAFSEAKNWMFIQSRNSSAGS